MAAYPDVYLPFELLVGTRAPDGYPVTVVRSPAGEGEARCHLEPAALDEALAALAQPRTVDAALLHELGGFLFDELFVAAIGELYRTSLALADQRGQRLRVRLRFAAPELAALPWEYLYDAREDSFLATAPETALVRYVPLRVPARPTEVEGPLRVLAVVSSPQDLDPLDVAAEQQNLRAALAAGATAPIELRFVERATVAAINAALRSFQPHVFHFVGHSRFHGGHAYVFLEDDDGQAVSLDEAAFQSFFAGTPETRLAVLNACQSAAVGGDQLLQGLAPRLLQRQLAAVVGMQFPMPQATARIFAREFYRCVALGFPIDAAVAEARKGIFQEVGPGALDWGIPVLFLRAEDGRLFARPSAPGTADQPFPTLAPPPEPMRPPQVAGFVGREEELALFGARLAAVNLAVIGGMAGVGKTTLATVLAARHPEPKRVFWHSFHAGEGVEAITWKLAGFLAHNGQDELWRLLEVTRQAGGKPPPPETTFDYLLQLVRGQGYLLCFDDFHHVDTDPQLNYLVARLRQALAAGELAIIITGRRMPEFVQLAEFPALGGLAREDVGRLARLRAVELAPQQQEQLHAVTGGNAEFLVLALDALRQARDPDVLLARLAGTDDVARYLLREVDDGLNGGERALMGAVAVLLNYGASREAIEAVLDAGSVMRMLRELADRHLLAVQEGPGGREYRQHAIVQAFYYDATSLRSRRQMHRRAGDYYVHGEPHPLRAAVHYVHAAEWGLAAEQATADVWGVINRGEARSLAGVLAQLSPPRLSAGALAPASAAGVALARGMALAFLGEREAAATAYAEVLALPPGTADALLPVQACRGMGELVEDESPQDALTWFARGLAGLAELADVSDGASSDASAVAAERGALLIKTGLAEIYLGRYAEAQAALEEGLALLPRTAPTLRATGLAQLGVIAMYTGDLDRAQAYTEQALALSRQTEDHFLAALILGNLGMIRHVAGDWAGGATRFREALAALAALGSEKQQGYMALNLGVAHLLLGEAEAAEQRLGESLALAQRYEDQLSAPKAWYHLAELRLRAGNWAAAQELLVEAEATARAVEDNTMLVWIYAAQAEATVAAGDCAAAEVPARQAVELGASLEAASDQGIGLRALGKVLAAQGDTAGALAAFEASAACLADAEPYETARTQAVWGQALLAAGETATGQALLEEARATFQQLGAAYDLVCMEEEHR